ncbi:uncharacterized protein LOC110921246 [Helianthus annuus]|uniref:uncharacterized protein LOC110921246 n=1 Tax=Helianthus annuus TaxID=4232 RepID=UPI0016532A6D|nr:uncharacterized protein LOC110921246 [Helianthus annuus]XP_035842574.1 uncharacterized protein LOC110921246 [Helianthus annuus]
MKWASSWSKFSFKGVGSSSQGVMDVRCGYGICCHGEEFQVQIDELKFYLIYLIRGLSFPFSVARKYSTERVLGLFDLTGRIQKCREQDYKRCTRPSEEKQVVFDVAEASCATSAVAAAEVYASSGAKCSTLLQLPMIPYFHKFSRWEQYTNG